MLNSSAVYWNNTYAMYQAAENPLSTLLVSFTQNLLSGIIPITNIMLSLNTNLQNGDNVQVQYDIARLLRKFLIFPKVEEFEREEPDRLRQSQ
jgi:hypothetical protein